MRIFTGNYENCKVGNLVSISGDKGKSVGFNGNSYTKLAPKKDFWSIWHSNIGKISELENTKYYMEQYYKTVLSKLDAKEVFDDLKSFGNNVILLCYENNEEFCHRHLAATWLEKELNITIPEISIDENLNIQKLDKNEDYIEQFKSIMDNVKENDFERD